MQNKRMLSFVLPVYNEVDSLDKLYETLTGVLQTLANVDGYELIFVDDGSTDGGAEKLKAWANAGKIKLISFRRNCGKAMALQAGFNIAQGDIIFTMDTDLQDNPTEIPNFIAKIDEGFDVVSGWKFKRYDPFEKRFASKIFNGFISRVFKIKLHDFNCGFKAYKKEVIKTIKLFSDLHRYTPILAKMYGFKIAEIKVKHHKREHGVSKFGYKRYLNGFLDFNFMYFMAFYQNAPIFFFGKLALILGILGGISLFFSIIWGVFLLLFAGQSLMLGIIVSFVKFNHNPKEDVEKYIQEKIL